MDKQIRGGHWADVSTSRSSNGASGQLDARFQNYSSGAGELHTNSKTSYPLFGKISYPRSLQEKLVHFASCTFFFSNKPELYISFHIKEKRVYDTTAAGRKRSVCDQPLALTTDVVADPKQPFKKRNKWLITASSLLN